MYAVIQAWSFIGVIRCPSLIDGDNIALAQLVESLGAGAAPHKSQFVVAQLPGSGIGHNLAHYATHILAYFPMLALAQVKICFGADTFDDAPVPGITIGIAFDRLECFVTAEVAVIHAHLAIVYHSVDLREFSGIKFVTLYGAFPAHGLEP